MFDTDASLIRQGLTMWANHIETGDCCLGAIDAKRQEKEINALSLEQMKLVVRIRELANKQIGIK